MAMEKYEQILTRVGVYSPFFVLFYHFFSTNQLAYAIIMAFIPFILESLSRSSFGYKLVKHLWFIFNERKRLEHILNHTLRKICGKENIPKKIKVKSVLKEKEEKVFIDELKKGRLVVSIKIKEDRSMNVLKALQVSIINGYLWDIKQYLSPDLANFLDFYKLYKALQFNGEHIALNTLIRMKEFQKVRDKIEKIEVLDQDNLLNNHFIPTIRKLYLNNIVTSTSIIKANDKFFDWLLDENLRLKEPFSNTHIPKQKFVYVRERFKDLVFHVEAIRHAFEVHKCKLCIVGARGRYISDLREVIKQFLKIYSLKLKVKIDGEIDGSYILEKEGESKKIKSKYVILKRVS